MTLIPAGSPYLSPCVLPVRTGSLTSVRGRHSAFPGGHASTLREPVARLRIAWQAAEGDLFTSEMGIPMSKIGTLKKWPATALWPHEATSFNPWLAEHLDSLDEALRADWTFGDGRVQQEAGSLWVDVVALTSDGRTACIEAQFGTSNHDHLGKLLTYIAAYDARVAVWIAEEPRPEHVQAIAKLNTGFQDVDFYMVRVEVVSVGDSGIKAPLLSVVAGPSPVIKTAGRRQAELNENQALLREYWDQLLPAAAKLVPAFVGKKPRPVRRIGATAGRRGVRYVFATRQHESECGLRILGGKYGDSEPVLSEVKARQAEIEREFGSGLEWVPGGVSRVMVTMDGGYLDQDRWPILHPRLVETMARLVAAVEPALTTLKSRPRTTGAPEEDEEEGEGSA
jgi:hypothetical protein